MSVAWSSSCLPSSPQTRFECSARTSDVDDQNLDEDDDPLEDPEAVHELHDHLIEIRRVLADLDAVTTEVAAVRGRKEAQRILTDLLEEIQELPDALAAAIASQDTD
jgi:hypothetical protein